MQYVGRAIGSVSKTWSSINPATLSGAIDIIVVEQENGDLACSPFHVRFGKFQLLRPSQKKVDFIVNGEKTDLPMKLGDGGEAFFVFETDAAIPSELQTSPVISPVSSPEPASPLSTPSRPNSEPDYLELGDGESTTSELENFKLNRYPYLSTEVSHSDPGVGSVSSSPENTKIIQKISRKLNTKNIPSKVDNNGNLVLDIQGYKSDDLDDNSKSLKQLLLAELGEDVDLDKVIEKDHEGNIMINGAISLLSGEDDLESFPQTDDQAESLKLDLESDKSDIESDTNHELSRYFKTLRLTSDQLKCLTLKKGINELKFSVNKGKSVVTANLYFWDYYDPIVISDIDGTITKSDALGHVFTMIGRDWTHKGVAKLFSDIKSNGYNIMYLTARSVGQADSTRYYLNNIEQEGLRLPQGPVILSPDRTMAALRREVILKKPEVFKMACLNDIKKLYLTNSKDLNPNTDSADFTDINTNTLRSSSLTEDVQTPFYAGFGNRITDALSYRSVGIPSSRIFTINPDGDVHMELLELAGYRSSYVHISELVDHFFPPVNTELFKSMPSDTYRNTAKFSDVNYWKEPLYNFEELSDEDTSEDELRRRKEEERLQSAPRSPILAAGASFFKGSSSLLGSPERMTLSDPKPTEVAPSTIKPLKSVGSVSSDEEKLKDYDDFIDVDHEDETLDDDDDPFDYDYEYEDEEEENDDVDEVDDGEEYSDDYYDEEDDYDEELDHSLEPDQKKELDQTAEANQLPPSGPDEMESKSFKKASDLISKMRIDDS
ncbi:hypothetical protein LJB42_002778 [Komagataella kurtzmanii]|nr:hypothetical protein LJB42_002778 [Komagataella kurtzmanii]